MGTILRLDAFLRTHDTLRVSMAAQGKKRAHRGAGTSTFGFRSALIGVVAAGVLVVLALSVGERAGSPARQVRESSEPSRDASVAPTRSIPVRRAAASEVGHAPTSRDSLVGVAGTTLHVYVSSRGGAALTSGVKVSCVWSTLRGGESTGESSTVTAVLDGPFASLRIPVEGRYAIVDAVGRDGRGRQRVELRRDRMGDWIDDDRVAFHEVFVTLEDWHPRDHVAGTLRVDGALRAPRGVRIVLRQDPPGGATRDAILYSSSQVACVDEEACAYSVGPVHAGARGLWVTSEETSPLWVASSEFGPGQTLDLDLVTGASLALTVLDASSQVTVAGLELDCRVWVPKGSPVGARRSWRQYALSARTNGEGKCEFSPLPYEGRLEVVARTGATSAPVIHREASIADAPRRRSVVVEVELPTDLGLMWGEADPGVVRKWPLAEIAYGHDVESADSVPLPSGEPWVVRAPAGPYRVWVRASDGGQLRRVSVAADVELVPGRRVGPVALPLFVGAGPQLHWTDPGKLTSLDVSLRDELGPLEPFSFQQSSAGGWLTAPSGFRGHAVIQASHGTQARISRKVALERTVTSVDLHGSAERRLEVRVDGGSPSGAGAVSMFRLNAPGDAVEVRAELRDGASTSRLGVAPGTYFCAVRQPSVSGHLLVGMVAVGELDRTVSMEWLDARVDSSELFEGAHAVVLTSFRGIPLEGVVPTGLRAFYRVEGRDPTDSPRLDLSSCDWREVL